MRAWDGTWDMVVIDSAGRPSGERASLRAELATRRLGELREGVWMRPATLDPPPVEVDAVQHTFTAIPDLDGVSLAAALWDLPGWARETTSTLSELAADNPPAIRLAVAAHLVRLLAADPLLPAQLCPPGWPAQDARKVYEEYQQEISALGAQ